MDNSKKILICIIILIVFIIVILGILFLNLEEQEDNRTNILNNSIISNNINNDRNNNNYIENNIISGEISYGDNIALNTTDYENVNTTSVYYAIKDISEKFFYLINLSLDENSAISYYGKDNYLLGMEESKEKIISMLGEEYLKENNINKNNLKEVINNFINSTYKVENIKQSIKENNICYYLVTGILNKSEPYKLLIITNEETLNYSIFPYDYIEKNNLNITEVKNKEYNKIIYTDITKEQVAKDHFADYQYYVQTNINKAYQKLNIEYKQKRFGNIEEYQKYIKDSLNIIKESYITEYKVTRTDDYIQYDCRDNYGNYYIFKEKDIMQYELFLDNYTIRKIDDIEYYNNLDDYDKAKYNLALFIEMVNTKDYNSIYNTLNNTFKNDYFDTKEKLEEYIKNNMYEINKIEILESDNQTYEYCIFSCSIINYKNENESKNANIIIKLEEGTNFKMSFSIN